MILRVAAPKMRMSHDEERANGSRVWDKRDRAPRHWLNPLVGRSSVPLVKILPRPCSQIRLHCTGKLAFTGDVLKEFGTDGVRDARLGMDVRGHTLLNVAEQAPPCVFIELTKVGTDIRTELGKDAVNCERTISLDEQAVWA
jgi:hypothetical protein